MFEEPSLGSAALIVPTFGGCEYPHCQLYEFCDRDNGLYVLNWHLKPEEAVMLQTA